MTVVKYDVSDVPEGGGGEQPQPGMYKGKIVSVTHRTKKSSGDPANDLEVVVDVGAEYARLWTYIQLENPASAWKLREFTDALGLPAKGGIDTAKITKQEPEVNVKVSADTDLEGNYRGRVKNLFKPGKAADADESAAEDGTDYETWELADLKAEVDERGLEIAGRQTVAKLAGALAADDEETADAQQDDAEPEDEAKAELPEEYVDIAAWDADDLKAELEKLDLKVSGRFSEAKARDLIVEHVSANGGEPAAAEPTVEDDYDEWELQELKDEMGVRNDQGAEIEIGGRVTKDKLIDALRLDDKNAQAF